MTKNLLKFIFVLLLGVIIPNKLHSQVTIGSGEPTLPGALLDVKEGTPNVALGDLITANRGIGMPRVNLEKIDDLKPCVPAMTEADKAIHVGLVVYNPRDYNEFCKGLYVWNSAKWNYLSSKPCDPCVAPVIVSCKYTSNGSDLSTWSDGTNLVWEIYETNPLEMTVVATSTEPLTYQWKKDGVNIAGATNAQYIIPYVTYMDGQADTGGYAVYSCEVKGCKAVTATAGQLNVYTLGPPPGELRSDMVDWWGNSGCLDVGQSTPAGCQPPGNRSPNNKFDLNHEYYVVVEYGWSNYNIKIDDPHGLIDMTTLTNHPVNYWGGWFSGAVGFKFKPEVLDLAKGLKWENGLKITFTAVDTYWGDFAYDVQNNPIEVRIIDCGC